MSATLLVRDLEPETKTALQAQAARNGRSMSAEARIILRDALRENPADNLTAAEHARRFFPSALRVEGGIPEFREPPANAPDFD